MICKCKVRYMETHIIALCYWYFILFVEPEETISQSFSVIVLLANINLGKQNTPGTVGPTSMNKYVIDVKDRGHGGKMGEKERVVHELWRKVKLDM